MSFLCISFILWVNSWSLQWQSRPALWTELHLFNSLVDRVLLYGCKAWTWTLVNMSQQLQSRKDMRWGLEISPHPMLLCWIFKWLQIKPQWRRPRRRPRHGVRCTIVTSTNLPVELTGTSSMTSAVWTYEIENQCTVAVWSDLDQWIIKCHDQEKCCQGYYQICPDYY